MLVSFGIKLLINELEIYWSVQSIQNKVGDQINQHIIKINKFALNGIFNRIITISDTSIFSGL